MIAGIVLLVIVLLGALLMFRDTVKKKPNNDSSNNIEEDIQPTENQSYYTNNNGTLLFDQYIYHSNDKIITDLYGKKLAKLDNNYGIRMGKDFIYEISNASGKERNIKRWNGQKFTKVLEKKYESESIADQTGPILNPQNVFLGMYDNSKKSGVLYLMEGETYKEITLPSLEAYNFSTTGGEPRYVYGNQYMITKDSSSNGLIGLYDIKNNKELIKPIYNDLIFAGDSKFIAVKNDKSGMIDANGKILIDFKYSVLQKSGNYYVAGKENTIIVLDANYNEIETATLTVSNLNKYTYHICCGNANPLTIKNVNNNLIIGVGATGYETVTYYYLDNNNQFIKLVSGYIETVDSYLLAQEKGNTSISIYDKNMNRIQGFDLHDSLENWEMSLFLNDYLVATQKGTESKFFLISTGENIKVINSFMRDYKEYRVTFTFTDRSRNLGTITVQKDSQELAKLENASFISYIQAENNGIRFINNQLVYDAGEDILVLK